MERDGPTDLLPVRPVLQIQLQPFLGSGARLPLKIGEFQRFALAFDRLCKIAHLRMCGGQHIVIADDDEGGASLAKCGPGLGDDFRTDAGGIAQTKCEGAQRQGLTVRTFPLPSRCSWLRTESESN